MKYMNKADCNEVGSLRVSRADHAVLWMTKYSHALMSEASDHCDRRKSMTILKGVAVVCEVMPV